MGKRYQLKITIVSLFMTLSISIFATQIPTLTAEVGYVNLKNLPDTNDQINPIRLQAIKETATQLGARGALAWRSLHINQALQQASRHLDHVFNFNQLLINNNIIPPVITQSDNDLNLADDHTIRLAAKTYKMVKNAHFVTVAPTWRTYLWMNYKKPSLPNKTLLPTTQAEAQAWNHYLQQGWISGLQQADAIFRENVARLRRDYDGMVLYNKLLAQHMVSKPYVAKADLGITGNGHQIRIKDEVLRITATPQLQPDASRWNPVITQ